MKTKTKSIPRSRVRKQPSVKGDIARAMFARWEKDHIDPKPQSWEQFKRKLEANRLRQAPLYSE
jgi:hypothetical protein